MKVDKLCEAKSQYQYLIDATQRKSCELSYLSPASSGSLVCVASSWIPSMPNAMQNRNLSYFHGPFHFIFAVVDQSFGSPISGVLSSPLSTLLA